jgi:hypothetical protein
MIKIVVKKLFPLQAFEDPVLPEEISSQPERLMDLENKYDISQRAILYPIY